MASALYRPEPVEPPPQRRTIGQVLALAYRRECFVCGRTGQCKHREPDVELAIVGGRRTAPRFDMEGM